MIDPELEAITKCTELLKELDEESKVRVIQYLVSRYKLGENSVKHIQTVSNDEVRSPKAANSFATEHIETLSANDLPTLRDVVAKDLPNTEVEWVLIYCYYAAIENDGFYKREDIINNYKISNRWTEQLRKNLSSNITQLIKKDYIKSTNNTDFIMKEEGNIVAGKILEGTNVGKPRKNRQKK